MDETTVKLDPVLRACWMKVGQQKRVPMPANHQKRNCHVFGAYNWKRDQVCWTIAEWKNTDYLMAFLEHLLIETYPTHKVILVRDRASFHRSPAALAALSLFEHRLRVIGLPAYCSELNPIERFWRHLKDLACANRLWSSLPELFAAVEKVLHLQNCPDHDHRFALSKNFQ